MKEKKLQYSLTLLSTIYIVDDVFLLNNLKFGDYDQRIYPI